VSTRSRECQVEIVQYFLGQKIDPNQPDSTYKDVLDHACQRDRTGVVRTLLDEPTSLVKARVDARALACKRRLLPQVERSPSLGSVIGALAIIALTALIWLRGKWLFDKVRRVWDPALRDTLQQATVHVVCHGFVLCVAAWYALMRR
jgi:hypothetical protein